MAKWVCFGMGFVLCLALVEIGEIQWANAKNRLDQADLSQTNHPDLFRWNWKSHSPLKSNAVAVKSDSTSDPENQEIEVRSYQKGTPIPFDELDNTLAQRVFFDYDRSLIKPEAAAAIEFNSAWLLNHPHYDILLEGHCDERGSSEYNLALGERRAEVVRQRMIELGIPAERISTRSWGEEKPLDLRKTDSAFGLNRRVEFYAIPQ
ncbi:MAG: OmpA family protein [bacterium]|jgi:peptidoglycan-associated lipoprotein|nr:OmpA family protein [bacterium]